MVVFRLYFAEMLSCKLVIPAPEDLNRDLCFFWVSSLAYPNLLGEKRIAVYSVSIRSQPMILRNELITRQRNDQRANDESLSLFK